MLTSNITGVSAATIPAALPEVIEVRSTISAGQGKKIEVNKNMTVEEYVRNYFSDIPVMIEIAKCESRFRQHDATGQVLRGEQNNFDRGVMQINEYYHSEDSQKLGYDIMTIEGNTSYARTLFEKYGVKPWASSAKCWSKTMAYAEYQELSLNK